jgi:hypothetical protein
MQPPDPNRQRQAMHFHDDPLDHDFPLGDGTADTDARVVCPYCASENVVFLDPGSGARQEYVEDCQVCCRPWRVRVEYAGDGSASVDLGTADGS